LHRWSSSKFVVAVRTAICCALALLCLGAASGAGAQGSVSGTFVTPGGTVAVGKFRIVGTLKCPENEPDPGDPDYDSKHEFYEDCRSLRDSETNQFFEFFAGRPLPGGAPSLLSPLKASAQDAAPASLSFATSEATLPFLGNRLILVSFVPNSTVPGASTSSYAIALRRQSDCSLIEDFYQSGAATPSTVITASLAVFRISYINSRG
jgi:hypothetical protein